MIQIQEVVFKKLYYVCHNYNHNQMFEYYQAWAPLEKFCNEALKKYAMNCLLMPDCTNSHNLYVITTSFD